MNNGVISFNVSQDYYITKAIEYEMNGDMLGATHMVRRALELKDDLYIKLKLASFYEAIELYEEANDIYVSIIAKKGPVMHCFFALCDNMMHLSNDLAAGYYATQYNNLAYTDDERQELEELVQKHTEEQHRKSYKEVPKWVTLPPSEYFNQGLDAFQSEKYAVAEMLFSKVPIECQNGILALEGLIAVGQMLRDNDIIEKTAKKILEYIPTHVMALTCLLELASANKNKEQYKKYMDIMSSICPTDESEAEQMALQFLYLNEIDKALTLLDKYLDENPTKMKIKYLYAAACFNNGLYQEAFKKFSDICKISDPFGVVAHYKLLSRKKIDTNYSKKPKEKIPYDGNMQEREQKIRSQEIFNELQRCLHSKNDIELEKLWQKSNFRTDMRWCISNIEDSLCSEIIAIAIGYPCKKMKLFFEDAFLSTMFTDNAKRYMLREYAYNGVAKKVTFSCSGIICETKLDVEVITYPEVFKLAYACLIYVLAPIAKGFEKQLKKTIRQAIAAYIGKSLIFKNHQALAALFASTIDFFKNSVTDKEICTMFGCNHELMQKYKKGLDL